MGCTVIAASVHEILFAAVIGRGNDRIREAAGEMVQNHLERKFLFSAAENCGSAAALMAFLSGIGIPVPSEEYGIREAAAREFAVTDSMRLVAENVFSALDDAGIPFAPLKGADPRMAEGSRKIANPMDDVDVLVRRGDAESAGYALEKAGFRFIGAFSGAHMNLVSGGPHPGLVEVHWDLVNREDLVQSALFSPDMAHVWERMAAIGGRACLGGEDCLCYFAAHAVKEYFRSPKWLADLAFMLGKTKRDDAESVRRVADEWGVRPSLGLIAEALIDITGDMRYASAFESFALYPGLPGRGLVARMLKDGGLGRLRPFLWLAAARSPGRVCAVLGGMGGMALRKTRIGGDRRDTNGGSDDGNPRRL